MRGAQESGLGREMVNLAQGPTIQDWASTDALVSGSTTSGPIVGPKDARKADWSSCLIDLWAQS